MKLCIRGNTIRLEVSKIELAKLAETGKAALPKSRLDLWVRRDEASIEGSQPIGGGKVLQIVLEKNEGAQRAS